MGIFPFGRGQDDIERGSIITNYLIFDPLIQMGIKQIKCESLSEEEIIKESDNIVDRIAGFMEESVSELLRNNPGFATHIKYVFKNKSIQTKKSSLVYRKANYNKSDGMIPKDKWKPGSQSGIDS